MQPRQILPTLFALLFFLNLNAQNLPYELAYEGLLWAPNDTFYVNAPNWDKPWSFTTMADDTVDLGTAGFPGQRITVWTSTDTLTVPYVNAPYQQWLFIKVGSPHDTTVYRMRFNEQMSAYTADFVRQQKGKTRIQIPETYELANIILYLSDCSVKTGNHPESSAYAREVAAHFGPFKRHPLIRLLNQKCGQDGYWDTYYGFRENSICFRFDGPALSFDTPYKIVWWGQSEILGGMFREYLYLVQDFANQSGFRDFYAAHQAYYRQLEKRQAELMPIASMWAWLEKEFPQRQDAYAVYFSPLIGGSHSTQRFYKGDFQAPEFRECVMFINAPEDVDARRDTPEKLKEGLMSGIVFTEIDHNYVNPTSEKHIKAIKALLSDKNAWATPAEQQNYSSEFAIFNEYMTHGLFCLYVSEHYTPDIAQKVIESRMQLMQRRGYPKFKAFFEVLNRELSQRKETVFQAYGRILAALEAIK